MTEDGIPEILAEQRLGHEVPGMRGLYAHASVRTRDGLKAALQARWTIPLDARAAIHPHSPVRLLDELLAPFRGEISDPAAQAAPRDTQANQAAPRDREEMISQIPPRHSKGPAQATRVGPNERASDLVRHRN
jgi:hypothetical protein